MTDVAKQRLSIGDVSKRTGVPVKTLRSYSSRGAPCESDEAKVIVDQYLAGLARIAGSDPADPKFRAGARQRFERQDPRASRYWELVAIMKGTHPMSGHADEWRWIVAAVLHHVL